MESQKKRGRRYHDGFFWAFCWEVNGIEGVVIPCHGLTTMEHTTEKRASTFRLRQTD